MVLTSPNLLADLYPLKKKKKERLLQTNLEKFDVNFHKCRRNFDIVLIVELITLL
jgi:hypothetical protein